MRKSKIHVFLNAQIDSGVEQADLVQWCTVCCDTCITPQEGKAVHRKVMKCQERRDAS